MKQILVLLLSLSLFAAFTACGDDEKDKSCDGKGIYCVDGEDVQPSVQVADGSGKSILTVDDKQYRDLNANGEVDAYEDWTLPVEERAADLVSKMTTIQKAGLLYEKGFVGQIKEGSLTDERKAAIKEYQVRVALFRDPGESYTAEDMVNYTNEVQAYVESEPLGVPFVFCCDPSYGTGLDTDGTTWKKKNTMEPMGDWPFALGMAAIDDADYVKKLGAAHAKEYKAMGLRMLLGPQCDPISEPRWARSYDTFGADPVRAGVLAKAYIQGLQETDNGFNGKIVSGIAAVLKHFPGGGTNNGGLDSHSASGQWALFKGDNMQEHLDSFKVAFESGPLGCMPCYSINMRGWVEADGDFSNNDLEEVASSYNKTIMQDYLRDYCGWDGLVSSDWGVLKGKQYGLMEDQLAAKNPTDIPATAPAFSAWGVSTETSNYQSYLIYKYWVVGGHQVGSGSAEMWLNAVSDGFLTDSDLNEPASKVLEMMFRLGVFENPYINSTSVNSVAVNNRELAEEAMKKAVVLVKNEGSVLPMSITDSAKVYFDGIDDSVITNYSSSAGYTVTTNMSEADYIILRVTGRHGTYSGLAGGVPLSFEGDVLTYNSTEWRHYTAAENEAAEGAFTVVDSSQANSIAQAQKIKDAIAAKADGARLILSVFAPRPFLFDSDIEVDAIDAILVEFGITDTYLLDAVFGADGFKPSGKLPFCIPKTDADVEAATEDLFNDEANQLFKYGTSLSY